MSLLSILNRTQTAPAANSPAQADPSPTSAERLEDVLMDLAKWGCPSVGQYGSDGTWHARVEVNVTPIGAKFTVRSDFNQPTPLAAALQCRDRLRDSVKALGGPNG